MKGHFYKRNKKWAYMVDVGINPATGKRIQKNKSGFNIKKEAQASCAKLIDELESGTYVSVKKMKFEELMQEWIDSQANKYKVSTFGVYKGIILNRLMPSLGKLPVHQIKAMQIERYYQSLMEEGLTDKYVRLIHNVMRALFDTASRWEIVQFNIMDKVLPPSLSSRDYQIWSMEQANQFLGEAKLKTKLYPFFVLAIYTGMRRGEIFALKWSDVDFNKKLIQVNRTLAWASGIGQVIQDTKTSGSRRVISVSDFVLKELRVWKAQQNEDRLSGGSAYETSDFIFTTVTGKIQSMRHAGDRLHKISQDLGLPRIRIHDLRHTHATMLLDIGEHPKIVSERLGHKSIEITMNLYSHVMENMQRDSADRLEEAMNLKRIK